MKKLLVISLVLFLTGCLETPVARHFPDVPEELKVACPDLQEVNPNTTKLSEVIEVVTDNYASYAECKAKVDTWIEWYKTQRSIFESVK